MGRKYALNASVSLTFTTSTSQLHKNWRKNLEKKRKKVLLEKKLIFSLNNNSALESD